MGQYHLLANIDKREMVDPARLGLGAKQREHTGRYVGSLSDAMYLLTMTSPGRGGGDWADSALSGRWVGDRVMVVGDYTTDGDVPGLEGCAGLYGLALGEFTDISEQVADFFTQEFGLKYHPKELGLDGVGTFTLWQVEDPRADEDLQFVLNAVAALDERELRVWAGLVRAGMKGVEAISAAKDVHA